MGDIAEDSDIEEEFHAVLEKIKTEDIKTEPNFEFMNTCGNDTEIITLDDDRRSERPPQGPRAPKLTPWRAAKKRLCTKTVAEKLNLNRSVAPKTYKGPKSKEPETLPKAKAKPSTLCRLCAKLSFVTVPIFGKDKVYKNIVQKIEHCLSVVVKRTDTLPQRVCRECLEKLEFCHNFHESVAQAEKQLTILDNKRSNRSPTVKEETQRLDPIMLTANKEEINVSRRGLDTRLKRKRIGEKIPQVSPWDDNFLSNLRLDWNELIPVQSGGVFGDQSSELFHDPPKIKLDGRFTQRKSTVQLREMLKSSEKLCDYRVHPSLMVRTYQARHKPRREAKDDDVIICSDLRTKVQNLHRTEKGKIRDQQEQTSLGDEDGECFCRICGICYRNWEELEAHEEDHEEHVQNRCDLRTPRAKGGYTCDHCGNGFLRKSTLLMHVENHVGKKLPYEYQNHR